jgi:hypothetical protein
MDRLIEEVAWWKEYIHIPCVKVFMSFDPKVIQINNLQKYLNITSPVAVTSNLNIPYAKAVPIQDLYDFRNIKKYGANIKVSCVFHEDKNPSAVIYVKNNNYHCFSCGIHLDSIAFIMKLQNLQFKEAVQCLMKMK